MKTRIWALGALVLALGVTSCNSTNEESADQESQDQELCVYSYNEGTSSLTWTAFKTSAKVGVAGTFNDITVTSEDLEDPLEVLRSIEFTIETSSVETQNEERNGKIAEHFFGTINTPQITGGVKSIDEATQTAVITITMNDIDFAVRGTYSLDAENNFEFNSTIDVSNWNALAGIEALNTVCEDLHKGDDGVSKLWSEVTLNFKTRLKSDC